MGLKPSRPRPPLTTRSLSYQRIYAVVRRIPRGKVATYGQVAALAGIPGQARQVGYALHALRDGTGVPWHRVVNAAGRVSRRAVPGADLEQRVRLEAEGIPFDARGRLPLEHVQWEFPLRSSRAVAKVRRRSPP